MISVTLIHVRPAPPKRRPAARPLIVIVPLAPSDPTRNLKVVRAVPPAATNVDTEPP